MTRCQSPVLLVSDTSAQTLSLDRVRVEACSNQPILSFSIVCTVNEFFTSSDSAQLPQGRTLGGTKVGTLGLLGWTIGITGSYFNTAKSKNTSHSRVWGLFQVIHSSQALLHFLISIWGQTDTKNPSNDQASSEHHTAHVLRLNRENSHPAPQPPSRTMNEVSIVSLYCFSLGFLFCKETDML